MSLELEMALKRSELDKENEARRERNAKRIALEARVMRHYIRLLKKNGWECYKVYDGGENIRVRSEDAAMNAICAVDEAWAYFKKDKASHYIYFVRGNAPSEVVSDWSYSEGDADGFNKLLDDELLPYGDKIEKEEAFLRRY